MHIVINGAPYEIGDQTDVAWLYRQCYAAANGAVTTLVLADGEHLHLWRDSSEELRSI